MANSHTGAPGGGFIRKLSSSGERGEEGGGERGGEREGEGRGEGKGREGGRGKGGGGGEREGGAVTPTRATNTSNRNTATEEQSH